MSITLNVISKALGVFNQMLGGLWGAEIHLPHPDLQLIPEADRLKWADALDTSVQHKGLMCNEDDTAHCCLCVAERALNGSTFKNYTRCGLPSDMESECITYGKGQNLESLSASYTGKFDASYASYEHSFAQLNDTIMTHPQIARLLRGKAVLVRG